MKNKNPVISDNHNYDITIITDYYRYTFLKIHIVTFIY